MSGMLDPRFHVDSYVLRPIGGVARREGRGWLDCLCLALSFFLFFGFFNPSDFSTGCLVR